MKRCPQCKKKKNKCEFGRLKSTKDGRRPECRECRKKYYLKPEEQVIAWNKRRKERMTKIGLSSKGIKRSEETRERIKKAKRELFKDHDYTPACIKRMFATYLKNGSNINFYDLKYLIFKNCFYCGEPPKNKVFSTNRKNFIEVNGIDRIDNDKDYSKENIVTCCKICNYAKRDMTLEDFKQWVTKVYKNFIEVA